jgi:hypothetical protein
LYPTSDKLFVSPLLRHAEEILETAIIGSEEIAIVVGRQGTLRIVDPTGWALPALRTEFGAAAVYRVERRGRVVCVEGWDGDRSCRLEKASGSAQPRLQRLLPLPIGPAVA